MPEHNRPKRYRVEPCNSPEIALSYVKRFPNRFFMQGALETEAEAVKFWERKIQGAPEELHFVIDTFQKNAVVCMDLKHVAEQLALFYEVIAAALGQA